MIAKIVNFVKYNNFFTIGLMCIVLGSGVTFAATSPAVISSQTVVKSIDNSYIIKANVDGYDFGLKITNITEDQDNYYVSYTYNTIALVDYVWKDVVMQKSLIVNKQSLNGKDLGLFVSEQLGQVIDSQRTYLASVKQIETSRGQTQKIVSTVYSGLVGRMLGSRDKVFSGYYPVIAPVRERQLASVYTGPDGDRSQSIPLSMRQKIENDVADALAKKDEPVTPPVDQSATTTAPTEIVTESTTTPPVVPPTSTTTTPVATLSEIAITTPASKTAYTVGDALDISGLVVTGTYSDNSIKVEAVSTSSITGFDSSTTTANQMLTISFGGKTTAYAISVVAATTTIPIDNGNGTSTPPVVPPNSTTTPPTDNGTTTTPVVPPVVTPPADTTPPADPTPAQ